MPPSSLQCSPREPGATPLGDLTTGGSSAAFIHAPANVVERRRVLAMTLRALAPGASLIVVAHNTKGGGRITKELESFGCKVESEHKRHHRIALASRPAEPVGLDEAIADGDALLLPDLGLWSQPGLFNWDRIDPGSLLLLDHLPVLEGRGADLGCGIGVLARAVREKNPATELHLIDIDARALHMSRLNVPGDRVFLHWADVRSASVSSIGEKDTGKPTPSVGTIPTGLDFVVCNPPFHDAGEEDKSLGKTFIARAAEMLKPGGTLWLTANRHLPYEAALRAGFEKVVPVADAHGFKVYEATKGAARERLAKSAQPGRHAAKPAVKARFRS